LRATAAISASAGRIACALHLRRPRIGASVQSSVREAGMS
jgi:hypothetical protein